MTRFMLQNARDAYERMKAEQEALKNEDADDKQEKPIEKHGVTYQQNTKCVNISGGENQIIIRFADDDIKIEKKPAETPSVPLVAPTELCSEKAKNVLLKYIRAGYLDECYQPLNLSRAKKAILAYTIAKELKIKNMWKLFESFWNLNALSSAYYTGVNQPFSADFLKEIENIK